MMDRLPSFLMNQTKQRQVGEKGLEILKKHEVPVLRRRG